MESFLAYLARQYRRKAEDVATDTLAYLLNHFRPANEAFRGLLARNHHPIPEDYRVVSRTRSDNGGVPDLLIQSEELCRGIIEIKFWAPLTPNQPVKYFDDLEVDAGFIIFIVPEGRKGRVTQDLAVIRSGLGLSFVNGSPAWPGNHAVRVVTWGEVLETLQGSISTGAKRGTMETEAFMFLYQLRRLCDVEARQRVKPLSTKDLDKRLGKRVIDYGSLIDFMIDDERVGFSKKKSQVQGSGPGWSGYFGKLAEKDAWIGFDAGIWSKYGKSPIWLIFERPYYEPLRKVFSQWLADKRAFVDEIRERIEIPILLLTGAEQDEVIRSAVNQLNDIRSMLAQIDPSTP